MGRLSELFRELKENGQNLDGVINDIKNTSNAFNELKNNISDIKMNSNISEELNKIKNTINDINNDSINIKDDSTKTLNNIIEQLETIYDNIKIINEYEMAVKVCPTPINIDKIKDEIEQQIKDQIGQIDFNLELSSQTINTTTLENQMNSFVRNIVNYIETSFNNIQNDINNSMKSMNDQLSQMTGTVGNVQNSNNLNIVDAFGQIISQGTFGSMQSNQENSIWQTSMTNFANQMDNATKTLAQIVESINNSNRHERHNTNNTSHTNNMETSINNLIELIREAQNIRSYDNLESKNISDTIQTTLITFLRDNENNINDDFRNIIENHLNNFNNKNYIDDGNSLIQTLESWNDSIQEAVTGISARTNELLQTLNGSLNNMTVRAFDVSKLFEVVKDYKDNNLLEQSDIQLLNKAGFDNIGPIIESLNKIGKDKNDDYLNFSEISKSLLDGTNLDETIELLNSATINSANAFEDFSKEINELIIYLKNNEDKIKDDSIKNLIKGVDDINFRADKTGTSAISASELADLSGIKDEEKVKKDFKDVGNLLKSLQKNYDNILDNGGESLDLLSQTLKKAWQTIKNMVTSATRQLESWSRTLGVTEVTHSPQDIIGKEMSYYNDRHTYRVNSAKAAYSVGKYFNYDDAYDRTYNQAYKYHSLSNGLIDFDEYNNRWNNMTSKIGGHYGQDDVGSSKDINFMTQNLFAFEKIYDVDTTEMITTLYKDLNMNAANAVLAIQNIGTAAASANIPVATMMNSIRNISKSLKNIGVNVDPINLSQLIINDVTNGNTYESAVSEIQSELENRYRWGDSHTGESIFAQILSGSGSGIGSMFATAKLGLGDASSEMATMANLYGGLLGGSNSAFAQGYMVDVLKSYGYNLKQSREGAKIYSGIADDERMKALIAQYGSGEEGLRNWLSKSDSAKTMTELQVDTNKLLSEIAKNTGTAESRLAEIGSYRSDAQSKNTEFQDQYFINSEVTGKVGDQYIDTLSNISLGMVTASGTIIDKMNEIGGILNNILGTVTGGINKLLSKFGISPISKTANNTKLLNGNSTNLSKTGLSNNYINNGVIDNGSDLLDYYNNSINGTTNNSVNSNVDAYNTYQYAPSNYGITNNSVNSNVDAYGAYQYMPSNYGTGDTNKDSWYNGQVNEAYYGYSTDNNTPYISGFAASTIGRAPGIKNLKKWAGNKTGEALSDITKDAIYKKKFNSLYNSTYDDLLKNGDLIGKTMGEIDDIVKGTVENSDELAKVMGGLGVKSATTAAKGIGKAAGAVGLDALLSVAIDSGMEAYQYNKKLKEGNSVYGDGHLAVANVLGNVDTAIGSGIGGAIGGTIGSAFGPVGTIAGGIIGSWAGGKIGGYVGDQFGSQEDWQNNYLKTVAGTDLKTMENHRNILKYGSNNVIANAYSNMGIDEETAIKMGDIISTNADLFKGLNANEKTALALKLSMDDSHKYLDENNKATEELRTAMKDGIDQLVSDEFMSKITSAIKDGLSPEAAKDVKDNEDIIADATITQSSYNGIDWNNTRYGSYDEYLKFKRAGVNTDDGDKLIKQADKDNSKLSKLIDRALKKYYDNSDINNIEELFKMDENLKSDETKYMSILFKSKFNRINDYNYKDPTTGGIMSKTMTGNSSMLYEVMKGIQSDYKSGKTDINDYEGYKQQAFNILSKNNDFDKDDNYLMYLADKAQVDDKDDYKKFNELLNQQYDSSILNIKNEILGSDDVTKNSTLKELIAKLPDIIKNNTSSTTISGNSTSTSTTTGGDISEEQYNTLKQKLEEYGMTKSGAETILKLSENTELGWYKPYLQASVNENHSLVGMSILDQNTEDWIIEEERRLMEIEKAESVMNIYTLINQYEKTHGLQISGKSLADVIKEDTQPAPIVEEDPNGSDNPDSYGNSGGSGTVTPQALPTNNLSSTMVNTSTLMSAILDAKANPSDMTKAYSNGRLLYTKGANGMANYKSFGGTSTRNSSLGVPSYGAVIDNIAQYGASNMNMSDFQYSMQALRLATDQEEYNSKNSYDYWGYNNLIGQDISAYAYDAIGSYNSGYNIENKDKGTVQINVFAEDANLNRKLQIAVTNVLEESGYKTKIDSSYDMASAALDNTQTLVNNING